MLAPFDDRRVKNNQLNILWDIIAERNRQDAKWGEQHWPDGTAADFKRTADRYRTICNNNFKDGTLAWADIAKEEFYEALAEVEWSKIRTEIIQTIAVLVAWIEDGDARDASTV